MQEFFPTEGVYLNLPEYLYFAADALGSSDIKTLLREPATWWYKSRHNSHRRISDSKSASLRKGSALHTLILEGERTYERRYVVEPDEKEHADKARTAEEIQAMLKQHGVDYPRTYDKAKLIACAKQNKLAHLVWDCIWSDYKTATSRGQVRITRAEDIQFRHMAALVHAHPDLGPGLAEGLSEVSVYWRRDDDPDTLHRARLDSLLPKVTVDLKTLSNWQGRDTRHATTRQITELEYDVQRVFYDEARAKAREFIRRGDVFVYDDDGEPGMMNKHEAKVLDAVASNEKWAWVWIFYQLRNDDYGKERAPVLIPWVHNPEGQVYDQAKAKVEKALENFRAYRARYGFETPWAEIESILEIEDSHLSSLMFKGVPG